MATTCPVCRGDFVEPLAASLTLCLGCGATFDDTTGLVADVSAGGDGSTTEATEQPAKAAPVKAKKGNVDA